MRTGAIKTGLEEKTSPSPPGTVIDISVAESQTYSNRPKAWLNKISAWGIEVHGVEPVSLEERTDKRFINVFFVWFTMSTNLLPYVKPRRGDWEVQLIDSPNSIITGILGTLSFGISLRDCSLLILFFSMVCTVPAAYFSTFGSRTGLRQMLHARYTFG